MIILAVLVAGCTPGIEATSLVTATQAITPTRTALPTLAPPTPTTTPQVATIWISPDLPAGFLDNLTIQDTTLLRSSSAEQANLHIDLTTNANPIGSGHASAWVYVMAVPFPTSTDTVSTREIMDTWNGTSLEHAPIFMTEETRGIFTRLWGEPAAQSTRVVTDDLLLESAWSQENAWTILPFDALEPRWKVLRIDDLSPFDRELNLLDYPLTAWIGWVEGETAPIPGNAVQFPKTNRDMSQMTVLVMTGTTALVRHTAEQMEINGVNYPAEEISAWLSNADITHISNEAPFYSACPPAVPYRVQARFCSSTTYLQLLHNIGADVIELTGNHLMDWGPAAMQETLSLYQEQGFSYYGGGENLQEARQPLLMEHNGNHLAFIGCNAVGPETDYATDERPGSSPCDRQQLAGEITRLRNEGYLPIVTFQHLEVEDYVAPSALRTDFRKVADAGAVIVSGSQAHVPHGFGFYNGAFLSYGLGNLFFDQMFKSARAGLIERHMFYQDRHISTEILSTTLVNSARRVELSGEERGRLLEKLFAQSDWDMER